MLEFILPNIESLLDQVVLIARRAGAEVMSIYEQDFEVVFKADDSPVTLADQHAEVVITTGLKSLSWDIPIVAEEAMSNGDVPQIGDLFWLVDPLDGTKEFIRKTGEFTVNIALIKNGMPILGVVFAPALDRLYFGALELGAWSLIGGEKKQICCRSHPEDGLTVVGSRSHGDPVEMNEYLKAFNVKAMTSIGSSLKLCLVATGEADLYPRFGRTMEWDIAAGDAILRAAGGAVFQEQGEIMKYGKSEFANPHFIAKSL